MSTIHTSAAAAALASSIFLTGCGMQSAPQPPSLNLPDSVTDLTAIRTGDQVRLAWTMPKKNTDKLLLKSNITVRVCRKEAQNVCDPAAADLHLAPAADGVFTDTLPAALASGTPRPLTYFVELKNRNGRSAGLSNPAPVLAGQAPPSVAGLAAEVRKEGVVLHWTPSATPQQSSAVRLHRTLLNPPAAKPKQGLLAPPVEPVEQNLIVESDSTSARALDKNIRFGQAYEYRAQRVARIAIDGKTLELAGELSSPIRVEALDIFPPAVPTGLAAVATAQENGTPPAIDLNWQPGVEPDLAGYAVYRREADSPSQRISPADPLVPPAFHDANVQPGHTYHYSVTAIDQGGHESPRSAETEETVPNP